MMDAVSVNECSNVTDCSLTVYAGFSGSDRHSVSLTTGLQLSKISQFALSTYFYNALAQVRLPTCLIVGGKGFKVPGAHFGRLLH